MGMTWLALALTTDHADEVRADPDSAWDLVEEAEPNSTTLDLDKMWHGAHWILTGTAWDAAGPLGQVILGGEEIGEDGGYGPPACSRLSRSALSPRPCARCPPTTCAPASTRLP